AVLDTGIAAHPWLDVPERGQPQPPDPFLTGDPQLEQLIRQQQEAQRAAGVPTDVFLDGWETPIETGSITRQVDTPTGHGTFIAGIVRQIAPDATVRAIRIMHSDGIVYESDLLLALTTLAERVRRAQCGNGGELIDVVCLALGYFSETKHDKDF